MFLWGSTRRPELSELSDRDLSLFCLPERFEPNDFLLLCRFMKFVFEPLKLLFEALGLFAFIDPTTAPSLLTRLTPWLLVYP